MSLVGIRELSEPVPYDVGDWLKREIAAAKAENACSVERWKRLGAKIPPRKESR